MQNYWKDKVKEFKRIKIIYLFAFIVVAQLIIFKYIPMYGIIIAFRRYKVGVGMFAGEWVGLRYFKQFLTGMQSWTIIKNTLLLGVYGLIYGFPAPIILALAFNEIRSKTYKRVCQTITYMPYFISTVIIVGIVRSFFLSTGIFSDILVALGRERVNIFSNPDFFRTLYIGSSIWKGVGFGTIIYLAALAGIDQEIYEAAIIDGAGRFQRMFYITIPSILPTIVILLILSSGSIISVGFEKAFLMQTPTNLSVTELISTYVYKTGILNANYSFGAAVGLFNAIVAFVLLAIVNFAAKHLTESSLW